MMSSVTLSELERTREVRQRELDVLESRLEDARRAHEATTEAWKAPATKRMPLLPVVAALVAVTSANAALFWGLVLTEDRLGDPSQNLVYIAMSVVSLIAMPLCARHVKLRRLAGALLLVSFAEVVYAAWRR